MGLSTGEIVAFICMIEWGIIHVAAMFMIGIPAWSDKSPYAAYDQLMAVDAYKKEYDAATHPRLSGKILWLPARIQPGLDRSVGRRRGPAVHLSPKPYGVGNVARPVPC